MNLGPDSVKKLIDLFSGRNQYHIPIYQRRYIWNIHNWESLWRDIIQLQHRINNGLDNKKHFAGTIITYKDTQDNSQSKWEVIDGQQRLTTFQVIFSVIRDLCISDVIPKTTASNILSDIDKLTKLSKIQTLDESSKYRLYLTEYDESAFMSVVSGELSSELSGGTTEIIKLFQSYKETSMKDQNYIISAYGYFGEKITKFLDREGIEKIIDLTQTLAHNVRVIRVELDDTDEPEKIFETINDTGRLLSDFDYLRNHIFLRIKEDNKPSLDTIYNKYWAKFEKWDIDKQENFLRVFLGAKLGPNCFETSGKLIRSFDLYRKYSNMLTAIPIQNTEYSEFITQRLSQNEASLTPVEYELRELSIYADSFDELRDSVQITKHSEFNTLSNHMDFYSALNLPRLDSFLLFLKHKLGVNDIHLQIICQVLESYTIRRMLYLEDYSEIITEINSFFLLSIEENKFSINDFVKFFCNTLEQDSLVKESLNRSWTVDRKLIMYILYRIELFKREQNTISFPPLCLDDLSVQERLINFRVPHNDIFIDESLGNLVPLRNELPDWSSCTFKAKIKLLNDELAVDLELARELHNTDKWDNDPKECIISRADDLFICFDNIWKQDLTDYLI